MRPSSYYIALHLCNTLSCPISLTQIICLSPNNFFGLFTFRHTWKYFLFNAKPHRWIYNKWSSYGTNQPFRKSFIYSETVEKTFLVARYFTLLFEYSNQLISLVTRTIRSLGAYCELSEVALRICNTMHSRVKCVDGATTLSLHLGSWA